jgi:hypothetical protein
MPSDCTHPTLEAVPRTGGGWYRCAECGRLVQVILQQALEPEALRLVLENAAKMGR